MEQKFQYEAVKGDELILKYRIIDIIAWSCK